MNLYRIFDWTWHLSAIGNVIWTIFIGLICLYYLFGLIFILIFSTVESRNTWKSVVIVLGSYILIPNITLFLVGLIGYWVTL